MDNIDAKPPGIASVDRIDESLVVVGLTDGTSVTLSTADILAIRPERRRTEEASEPEQDAP